MMEIRRSAVFRILLIASFLVLIAKVCLVIVKPLCTLAQRYEFHKCTWVTAGTRYVDYSSVFLMTKKEASHFDLQNIYKTLTTPSSLNKTEINDFKMELSKLSNPSMMIASRHNMVNAKNLPFALEEHQMKKIPVDIFKSLPYKANYNFGRPSRCSVVGSSGILNNSSCGREIDSADFVIRFNIPRLKGYKKDVGLKSDITTINPSQIQKQFGGLIGYQTRLDFLRYINQYHRYIWISGFASAATMEVCRSLLRTTRVSLIKSKLLFGNPQHWRSMTSFWRERGVKGRRLSSGIYWVANALSFCQEVHLYGFWPFGMNSDGEPIRYHYFTDTPPEYSSSKAHSFSDEFKAILQLHKKGVLQLHYECEP